MAIYNANGSELEECFSSNSATLEYAYDLNGNVVFEPSEPEPIPDDPTETDPYLENRILVFEDQFGGNRLDTNKWGYEIGYCRNNELQHYRPENVIVSNGKVNLKAIREHYAGDVTRNSTWTSGSIITSNKFEAFYGRWQAKIKFPKLAGSFCAFWLLGEGLEFGYNDDGTKNYRLGPVTWSSSGVYCGEIDITETIPGTVDAAKSNLWNWNGGSAGGGISGTIDISDWHIYEMEWTETTMQMMVDGVVFKTYDLTSENLQQYHLPSPTVQNGFYMILNQAVGASGGTPAEATDEMDMLVDWVRVYAPADYTQSQIYADSISIDSTLSLSVGDDVNMAVTWNPVLTFDRTTKWESSNENVVTCYSGRIKAISAGTATITVTTNNGKTATCTVTVGLNYDELTNVKGIAHRGYSTTAPENTLPAYELAKQIGFNYAETDISFTSDGVPVCLHDATIDRTSNGSGNINDLTFEQVRTYDFGSWKSSTYAGTKIPSFEEFINLCKKIALHPYIELKPNGSYTEAQIRQIVDMVDACGMKGKVTYISFSSAYLTYVKNYDASARLGYITEEVSSTYIERAQALLTGSNEVFISTSANSSSSVTLCRNANIPMEIWTIDNANTILAMDSYITGVTSNSLIAGKVLYEANIA